MQIFRLPGYTSDVDTLGRLVWARNPAGVWWPGEALDPYHMPPTRTVPPLAAAGRATLVLIANSLCTRTYTTWHIRWSLRGAVSQTNERACFSRSSEKAFLAQDAERVGVVCLQR